MDLINGAQIIKNKSAYYGGGVTVATNGAVTVNGGTIGAVDNGNEASYGGGVFVTKGTLKLLDGALSYNTAKDGGGIYTNAAAAIIEMQGGSMQGNKATGTGGAAWLGFDATFNMLGGKIVDNAAATGGAVAVLSRDAGQVGNLNISGGEIRNNTATVRGGGISVS